MADVLQYEGQNPPGLDVLSKYRTVVWKHPQHGWLKAEKNGSFTPLSEGTAKQLLGATTPAQPTTTTTTTTPAAPTGAVGAGSTKANIVGTMGLQERAEEQKRAKAEASHQATLDRAQFVPETGPDPMAGLGLTERARVQELVRGGMKVEDAVRKIRKPAAATQAEGLAQP